MINYKNNAKTTILYAISDTDLDIDLDVGGSDKLPQLGTNDWFYATIYNELDPNIFEIVKVSYNSGDLLKVERGHEDTIALSFDAGSIIEQRITVQTFKDIVNTKTRRYLDEFYISMAYNIPYNENKIMKYGERLAPDLLADWDSYWGKNVRCKIITSNGMEFDELSFPTVADIATWVDNNVVLSDSDACCTYVLKPYEIVDETIPKITKFYGMNRMFSALKGRRRYETCKGTAQDTDVDMTAAFNAVTSAGVASVDNRAIWLSVSIKNKYGMARMFDSSQSYIVNFLNSAGTRYIYNTNTSSFGPNTSYTYTNTGSADVKFLSLDINNNGVDIINYGQEREVIYRMRDGESICIAGKMKDNGNEIAMQVKPNGIDMVVTEMPDFAKYDFEMVFYNDKRQNHVKVARFTSMSDFSYTDFDPDGMKMRIKSSEWLMSPIYMRSAEETDAGSFNDFKWSSIKFRLRDKQTGAVSRESSSMIYVDNNNDRFVRRFLTKQVD